MSSDLKTHFKPGDPAYTVRAPGEADYTALPPLIPQDRSRCYDANGGTYSIEEPDGTDYGLH
jgi:hypothetical protein